MFVFDKDDEQYELVEYACHEANYGDDEYPQRRAGQGEGQGHEGSYQVSHTEAGGWGLGSGRLTLQPWSPASSSL